MTARHRNKTHQQGRFRFGVVLALLAIPVVLLAVRTGGVPSPLRTDGFGEPSTAAGLAGVHCRRVTIPVKLSTAGLREYDVVGDVCSPGNASEPRTLQILISGAGYGALYWDFPYRPNTYSFARNALQAGYATFNFHRLGIGESDHPFGLFLDVDRQAYVLSQIIRFLRNDQPYRRVVTVGHSFGSAIALAHALKQPKQVDGMVLTGFLHNRNPGFAKTIRENVGLAALSGPFAGRILDPTYIMSKPGQRAMFYTTANTEPAVIQIDEMNAQTTSIGEIVSTSKYFGWQSLDLVVPTLVLVGEDDFVVCGGDLDCHDHDAVRQHEQKFFPKETCVDVKVLRQTNHNVNLHLSAPEAFATMLDWVNRRVGSSENNPAEDPCTPKI